MRLEIIITLLVATVSASKWPLRASHKDDVPASFDCATRKAAFAYGRKVLPRKGSFRDLYYALDLNSDDCNEELQLMDASQEVIEQSLKTRFLRGDVDVDRTHIPSDSVYVDPVEGKDQHPEEGAVESPFKSIQAAADFAATSSQSRLVVLRGGTYYLSKTIQLTAHHKGIHFCAFPGEHPIISGGIKLTISTWKPYESKRNEPANIFVADISGQEVDDVPGLQIDGKRATRARFPNLPHGIEVSCGYGCMIPSKNATWNPPLFEKYGNVTYNLLHRQHYIA
jgi:hypothetical protein